MPFIDPRVFGINEDDKGFGFGHGIVIKPGILY